MELASLILEFRSSLEIQYADKLLPSHRRAMDAMTRCRTTAAGEVLARCDDCGETQWHPSSCGHRSCPKCQNHDATTWLDRQRDKLLPTPYFLLTFTLPAELRFLAWNHQRKVYDAMFAAVSQTLKEFGLHQKHLGAHIGFTMILQTHSRRLTYHPHLHVIVPGGGIDPGKHHWKRVPKKYLFNEKAMAAVFRGKLYSEIEGRELEMPTHVPTEWVVDCRHVGRGEKALEYLSRYLYRGVISEANILFEMDGQVTFRYTDWQTKVSRTETLSGADFLWRVLQHVLPRGFHRVRDYGLLHHSARGKLKLIQYLMGVQIGATPAKRPCYACSQCGGQMRTIGFFRSGGLMRIRAPVAEKQEGLAC